jgi:hypothetical protein
MAQQEVWRALPLAKLMYEPGSLLAILIAELCVNSHDKILPSYRVGAAVVRTPNSSVEPTGIEP